MLGRTSRDSHRVSFLHRLLLYVYFHFFFFLVIFPDGLQKSHRQHITNRWYLLLVTLETLKGAIDQVRAKEDESGTNKKTNKVLRDETREATRQTRDREWRNHFLLVMTEEGIHQIVANQNQIHNS